MHFFKKMKLRDGLRTNKNPWPYTMLYNSILYVTFVSVLVINDF